MGHLVALGGHADLPEHLFDAGVFGIAVCPSGCVEHEFQIVVDVTVGQKLEILEHYTYLAPQKRYLLAFYAYEVDVHHPRVACENRNFGIHRL